MGRLVSVPSAATPEERSLPRSPALAKLREAAAAKGQTQPQVGGTTATPVPNLKACLQRGGGLKDAHKAPSLIDVARSAQKQNRFNQLVAAANVNSRIEERLKARLALPSTPAQLAAAAKRAKMKEIRWRHPYVYRARMAFSWLANFIIFTMCAMHAVVYGRLFGKQRTNDMLMGWLTASGQTWAIMEPTQVMLLAVLPLLIKEDTRCGRCFERARTVYNECFA